MFDMQAVKQSFSRAAPVYDREAHLQARVRSQCVKLGLQYWPAGSHILDAGCGTGALAREIAAWRITGLDVSAGMCETVRSQQIAVVNANAEGIPFADASFDGVFSSLMLQWANHPQAALGEMARVVRHGGYGIVSTLTHGTLHELQQAFARVDDAPHVSDFLTLPDLLALTAKAGLTVQSCQPSTIIEHYPDALSLMHSLKAIGASNKNADRQRGLMTHGQLARLQQAYAEKFGDEHGLRATWQVLYMVLQKSGK